MKIMETKRFFQFKNILNVIVSSFRSVEYLCYGSTGNIFTITARGSTLEVVPRAIRVKAL